jgi:hypothetical protein
MNKAVLVSMYNELIMLKISSPVINDGAVLM